MFIAASLSPGAASVSAAPCDGEWSPSSPRCRPMVSQLGAVEAPINAYTEGEFCMRALLVMAIVFLIATFPATWLLMLFLGNTGLALSYWGTLPLGILVSVLLSGAAASV